MSTLLLQVEDSAGAASANFLLRELVATEGLDPEFERKCLLALIEA